MSTQTDRIAPAATRPIPVVPGGVRKLPVGRSGGGRRWTRLSTARTRIIGWVLLLVLAALGVVTFVTWRLLLQATDTRMDAALRAEVREVDQFTESGRDPETGQNYTSLYAVIKTAIQYNLARPNERFLGYVDGVWQVENRPLDVSDPPVLSGDPEFTALVGSVSAPSAGRYDSAVGEVRYIAVPVVLQSVPADRGVIVAAYLADDERAPAHEAARVMLGVGGLTTLAAAGAAWVVAGRILRPLRDVAATARTITETDLSGRIPLEPGRDGDDPDELRRLVRTVNAMLDRVESGVAAQRRFLDDAGHELRTPITIVRGHLEVLDPADPADVAATVALVDDELRRMNRMVSDLLLLARSAQPAFLQAHPVDVAELTRDIFDKVTRLGEREWLLDVTAPVDAVLDPQRVTQAVVALADNACRYTCPGDRIAIGSELTGGRLHIWVADSGPGVDEKDRTRIFERFARGTAGGPRSDGAGLGLSIVRAIAVAHGGRVEHGRTPGRGATFTLVLPAVPAPNEQALTHRTDGGRTP